jgi:8-oxo-dGTP diphosphatase
MGPHTNHKHLPGQPIRAASACVFRDGKVLLVKRQEGVWAFPGGKLLNAETAIEGAHRELMEETGVTADLQQLVGQFEIQTARATFIIHCYAGFYLAGEAKARSDAEELAWLLPSQTNGMKLAPHIAKAIMMAQRLLAF